VIRDLSLTITKEGNTLLIVPANSEKSGPASSRVPVFYNHAMEFNRDISVVLFNRLLRDGSSFLDGLTATGARGIRLANETGKNISLHLNDGNPTAIELARRNLDLNGVAMAEVSCTDLRKLLIERRFDAIDIDPFGSPAQFISLAAPAVRNGGYLCVTATDTGTVSGIFPGACLRRYGTRAIRTPFYHEIGVRNLLGFVAREAAREEVGIEPVIAFYADHYVRCIVRCRRGAGNADRSLKNIGFCTFDQNSLERRFIGFQEEGQIGPIWTGSKCDADLLRNTALPANLGSSDRISRYFELLAGENDVQRPHFTVDELARKAKTGPPKLSALLEMLGQTGKAHPTHFGPKTFVTDVEVERILGLMK